MVENKISNSKLIKLYIKRLEKYIFVGLLFTLCALYYKEPSQEKYIFFFLSIIAIQIAILTEKDKKKKNKI